MRCALIVAAALAVPSRASAEAPQIAVIVDHVDSRDVVRMARELDAFERALPGGIDFAFLTKTESAPILIRPFHSGVHNLGDLVAATDWSDSRLFRVALDELEWSERGIKRILILDGSMGEGGDGSTESELHRAERMGIIVHTAQLERVNLEWFDSYLAYSTLRRDIEDFLDRPLWPLNPAPNNQRRVALASGGTYHVLLLRGERQLHHWLRPMLDPRLVIDRARGPMLRGHDLLDDLAEGLKRPSEINPKLLPVELRDIDLEPLLDAIWDFVDARATFEDVAAQMMTLDRGGELGIGRLGHQVAESILEPRRLPPSRR